MREKIYICSYEKQEKTAAEYGISLEVLEEARRFSYVRCDVFENFLCISLEMLDFRELLLSRGSVVLYLEKERAFFFTSKEQEVEQMLESCMEKLGERLTLSKLVYAFLEMQMQGDAEAFDAIEKEILELEQALITAKKRDCVVEIIRLRKKLMVLKKYYEQFLLLLDILTEEEMGLFEKKKSLRLLQRRTERRFQNVLNLREAVTQVRESYEAEVDISLNTTMKIVTVVTTIFMPLTLIVGWYGMNFEMPEYDWTHGYFFVIVLSAVCILAGIIFFKKKHWF